MNLNTVLGIKSYQTQGFKKDGKRIPLTAVLTSGNVIAQIKTDEKEGYNAVQLGIGAWKKPTKSELGISKKMGLKTSPRFFREAKLTDKSDLEAGTEVNVAEVFEPGDIVDVVGVSKGKGFAGGVKRHGFRGGPRTHGQSDRERAPGSIGQTTTPGRVYKGKRMAGRMGHEQVTVKNLEIVEIKEDGTLLIMGLVPGPVNNFLIIKKAGKNKNFVPLYKEVVEVPEETKEIAQPEVEAQEVNTEVEEVAQVQTETPVEEVVSVQAEVSAENVSDTVEEVKTEGAIEPKTEGNVDAAPASEEEVEGSASARQDGEASARQGKDK